jgi:hypothetical protein
MPTRPLLFPLALAAALAAPATLHAQSATGASLDSSAMARRTTAAPSDTVAAPPQFGWFARGLASGAVAGPLGAWWITRRAANSDVVPSGGEAHAASVRSERREYAFVGSMIGTAALLFVVLKTRTHLDQQSGSSGPPATGSPGITRVPVGGTSVRLYGIPLSTSR